MTFSETVTVETSGGTPSLKIKASDSGLQDAVYASGSGSSELVFSWTVPADVPGNEEPISVPTNIGATEGLQLNGGAIKDSGG